MFKNILVATDGSDHAKRAAIVAADMAKVYRARLTIVNVQPLSLTLEDIGTMPQAKRLPKDVLADIERLRSGLRQSLESGSVPLYYIPAPQSAIHAIGQNIVNTAAELAKKKKVTRIERVALAGDAAQKILQQAQKSKSDLIVVGTRGLTRVGEFVLGSVSHKVVHSAKCPILTVK
jgi:nucleotide-binding universal stress UspA family protein